MSRPFAILSVLLGLLGASAVSAYETVDVLDPTKIPLGDGKVSSAPKKGHVYSCMTRFRGGGASHEGGWIHGDTWDLTAKITVRGRVDWPDAQFKITLEDRGRTLSRVVTGNGLPVESPSGNFPIARNDPAFAIDRNPNSVRTQTVMLTLPAQPALAERATCVDMGVVGYALNGVALFNGLDDAGRDAVAHEVQDLCDGHPQMQGVYHYHGPSRCMPYAHEPEALIGYAIDGFGVFSGYDASGRELTNADLDECHGRVSEIEWDGKRVAMYHYVLTREYPYTIGCFRGTPVAMRRGGGDRRGPPPGRDGRDGPPMGGPPMGGPPDRRGPPPPR